MPALSRILWYCGQQLGSILGMLSYLDSVTILLLVFPFLSIRAKRGSLVMSHIINAISSRNIFGIYQGCRFTVIEGLRLLRPLSVARYALVKADARVLKRDVTRPVTRATVESTSWCSTMRSPWQLPAMYSHEHCLGHSSHVLG